METRRYTCGLARFDVTFAPCPIIYAYWGDGQILRTEDPRMSGLPVDGECYRRDGYEDLGASIIAGVLSEHPEIDAEYDEGSDRFVIHRL